MLCKTKGLVLRLTKFRETSIILNVFTEQFGLQSYIVNGVRMQSAKSKIALYQPLNQLEMVVYHRPVSTVHRIREVKCDYIYQSLLVHPRKTATAMFILEMLNKTMREEAHVPDIFPFVTHALQLFDQQTAHFENFHLIFLIQLSKFLGFSPQHAHDIIGSEALSVQEYEILTQMLHANLDDYVVVSLSQRRTLLDVLLRFYDTHIDHLGEIRSLPILKELLS